MPLKPQFPITDGKKRCKTCKINLPLTSFYLRTKWKMLDPNCKECCKRLSKRWYENNKPRSRELSENWKRENPERHKFLMWRSHIRRKYGLSAEDYAALVGEAPRCAICGTEKFGGCGGKPMIDHRHGDRKVRGILCHTCNFALARIEKIPDWPERAREYLARNI